MSKVQPEKTKRKRNPDFTETECNTLMTFVKEHKRQLFGTGGKGSSKEEKKKEKYWKIASTVLRASGGPTREWMAIRKKWRDLCARAKAYKAPQTGGGPPPPVNPFLEKVIDIMAVEVVEGILPENDLADSQESSQNSMDNMIDMPSTSGGVGHPTPGETPTPAAALPTAGYATAQAPAPKPAASATFRSTQAPAPRPAASATGPYLGQVAADAARVRQCQIQEDLLAIQVQKLEAKQEQNQILSSILDVLRGIQQDLRSAVTPSEVPASCIDLLNSCMH